MQKQILYEGSKIFYHTYGRGKPVFLIHGFGEDGTVWINQIEYLKDKFKLIIPDLPGSGNSEMINDMSMEGMAEVIHSIIHEEDIETATVIGHSMGGYITLALVEKYWNHVDAFGLLHSTAFADSEEKKTIRKKGIEFIQRHGGFEFLKTTIPNLFSPNSQLQTCLPAGKVPNSIEKLINSQNNFNPVALVKYYEAMMHRPDKTAILKNTNVPVLFVMGKYDNAIPVNDSLRQCHLPGKVYFHILKQSAHMGMLEEPTTTNCILEKFFNEN